MVKKRLVAYMGKLNNKKIAEGINVARRNASRLLEDAEMLLDSKRYASAVSLAILSIEESGKEHILRRLAIASTDEEELQIWKDYRSHTKKNIMWFMPQLVKDGARYLDDFKSLFEPEAEHPYVLNQLKQISLYTDCLGRAHWSEPSAVIDEELARMLVKIAKLFVKGRNMEEKEIELWVKHLGKVKNSDNKKMKEALANWYAEMEELGLAPKGGSLADFNQWLGIEFDE